MFSSWFAVQGARNVVNPGPAAEKLAPTISQLVGIAKAALPGEAAARLPETAPAWVRISGAAQLVAALGYAVGLGRRPSAAVLAITTAFTLPSVVKGARARDGSGSLNELITTGALLGAAVLAAQDTEGKPSLVWRARSGAHHAVENVQDLTEQAVGKVQTIAS